MPAELLPALDAHGPEDLAQGPDGFLYTGVEGGAILRIDPATGAALAWADTGGRPLGLAFHGPLLYVADAERGLLRIDTSEGEPRVEELAREVRGEPLTYADGVHVASDGVVYFTAPSTRWSLRQVRYDGMETQPTGRLLRFDPQTGRATVEYDGLMFANGVTMSPDEDYVLVAEWSGYRLTRVFVKGPKRGSADVFAENLPGFPDNLSLDPRGFYWVGLVIERSALLDWLHARPFLMKVLPRIPVSWQPQMRPCGWLLGIDLEGRIVHNLQGGEVVGRTTGARVVDDALYLTSDFRPTLAKLPPPARPGFAYGEVVSTNGARH